MSLSVPTSHRGGGFGPDVSNIAIPVSCDDDLNISEIAPDPGPDLENVDMLLDAPHAFNASPLAFP